MSTRVTTVHRPPRLRRRPPRLRRGGFTLLEILIATAILTIGLVSIVALFPAAMNVGRKVIEESNAVVIGKSVAEAVRESIRNRKRYVTRNGITHVYFVFDHDGVMDKIPTDQRFERPGHDYFVLLPRYRPNRKFTGARESDRRFKALKASKTFVYPETDRPPNGNGDAFLAKNDADPQDFWKIRVLETYPLGKRLVPGKEIDVRDTTILRDIRQEVLAQYSYAFAISPSYFDADLSDTREFEPANQLYHVRVLVYRNFQPPTEYTLPQEPVYELNFEVSL